MRRYLLVIALFAIAVVLWIVYQRTKLPPGVEPKGPSDWLPWVSLVGSMAGAIGGVITLVTKVIDFRTKK